MAVVYDIEHTTSYKYKNPVTLAEHRALFLPRVGHGGRVLSYSITTNVPSKTRWIMDALSNSVALIEFAEPTTELVVTFKFRGEHYGVAGIEEFPVDPRGQEFPVQHTPDEWTDLASFMRPHAEDLDGSVAAWGRGFLTGAENGDRERVMKQMMDAIRDTFKYQAREVEGTQTSRRNLEQQIRHLPRLRLADDRGIETARPTVPLYVGLPVRLCARRRVDGDARLRIDACVVDGLSSGCRLAALRPDQSHLPRLCVDPGRGRAPSGSGDSAPGRRGLVRRVTTWAWT